MRLLQLVSVLSLLLLIGTSACNKTKPEAEVSEAPKQEKKVVLQTVDEAKAFIGDNLNKPIPSDYKIPSYITSGLPLAQVYDTLKSRYPSFYGKEGQAYVQAVMADPQTYLKLSLESKSIRRYYDPNSKY